MLIKSHNINGCPLKCYTIFLLHESIVLIIKVLHATKRLYSIVRMMGAFYFKCILFLFADQQSKLKTTNIRPNYQLGFVYLSSVMLNMVSCKRKIVFQFHSRVATYLKSLNMKLKGVKVTQKYLFYNNNWQCLFYLSIIIIKE